MIKSRIPVIKSKKILANNEVQNKENGKKTRSESAVVSNKVLCERKIQEKPIASKKVVCQQVYSQIPGKRHIKPNVKAASKVKYGTPLKVNSKSLPSKARGPNVGQRPILKSENAVYKKEAQKSKQKIKFPKKEPRDSYPPKLREKENLPKDEREPPHITEEKEEEKFETNNAFRQALLTGRDASPSILKSTTVHGAKFSLTSNRPSFYTTLSMSSDPYKTALKAIEDLKLAIKKESRPSPVRKASLFSTPMKNPFLAGDPSKIALKSLELLRTKKMMKSHKKVTFKFEENNALYESVKLPHDEIQVKKESESRLTDITERDESSQNSSRENSRKISDVTEELKALNVNFSLGSDLLTKKTLDKNSSSFEAKYLNNCLKSYQCINAQNISKENESEFVSDKNLAPSEKEYFGTFRNCSSNSTTIPDHPNKPVSIKDSKIQHEVDKRDSAVSRLLLDDREASDSLKCSLMQQNKNLTSNQNSCVAVPEEGLASKGSMYKTENRIFTPCPVSYKPHSSMNSGSPEFPAGKVVTQDVPICTPLVLKRLAKECEVEDEAITPIRLKLDFNDLDLNSKKEETPIFVQSPEKDDTCTGVLLRDIPTARKVLDLLTDEECSVILLKQKAPAACGRHMRNPLAVILSEGDEKHFIPVGYAKQQLQFK